MNFLNNMILYEGQHDKDSDYYLVGLNTDFVFPLHFHRSFELTLLLEGEMQVHLENEDITLRAGDMLFVGSNCIHDQLTVGSSKSLICIFSPDIIGAVSTKFYSYPLKTPVIRNVGEYHIKTFEALNENYIREKEGIGNPAITKGALYTLIGLFYEQLDFNAPSSYADRHALLGKIFEFVEENKESAFTLTDMAERLEYSPVYLSRFFHENAGIPFRDYVLMVKMNHACWLLKTTREGVLDIALRCGYSSTSSFNRIFKQIIGMSPLEYRKR